MMDKVLLVYSTAPDRETAKRIAEALVGERLAACVSMLPGVFSVYRWQGQVEEAAEIGLMIKTTKRCFAALSARLKVLHPYEVPEVVAVQAADGLPAYLQWVAAETGGGCSALETTG
ncbi:MAG: divalent-cation tolerance protein CutA [Alistipes senegalensis]|nr:divalent-cation tolerance protein CutA [Alistipes senegalensis]